MTPEELSRLNHLKRLKADILYRMEFESRNIQAWETLSAQSERYIGDLRKELKTFEVELLELMSQKDYEADTRAESILKSNTP